jgi:hypothetical protein
MAARHGLLIGYRIDQAFWSRAKDKTTALRTMLDVIDFKASGYPPERSVCAPQKPIVLAVR